MGVLTERWQVLTVFCQGGAGAAALGAFDGAVASFDGFLSRRGREAVCGGVLTERWQVLTTFCQNGQRPLLGGRPW